MAIICYVRLEKADGFFGIVDQRIVEQEKRRSSRVPFPQSICPTVNIESGSRIPGRISVKILRIDVLWPLEPSDVPGIGLRGWQVQDLNAPPARQDVSYGR